ncbi:MBL fold metallo-hydrolase [Patescibacteria group bacterium]|nr:MBL fold metallo-hydrolase [Patescibacteria group bacterium]
MDGNDRKWVLNILTGLFLCNILAWLAVYQLSQPQFLKVIFFDVGQGDAIFIETPQRHQILIDGGPSSAILEKLGKELPFYDRSLDLIILTHPDYDHISGLIEVLKKYEVENILWTGVLIDTAEYEEWQKMISKEGADIFIAQSGQRITASGALFDILYPFDNLEGQEIKDTNNSSVILRLVFQKNSFLFAGDVYKSVERKLLKEGIGVGSNVLKVGHHGSKTSSAEEFIVEVLPEIAVISVGKDNKYGHPHQEVLDILERYDIKVLRTDQLGDIEIVSDGNNLIINN